MDCNLENLINDFINNELISTRGLSDEVFNKYELKDRVFRRIFARRYRKYATSEDVHAFVRERLDGIIDDGLPMVFVPSFGGYKHWWSPTYPNADWAEVFNVKFLLEYLMPICNSYKDVSIEYESEEVILAELNNIPQSGLDDYTKSFRAVLERFQKIIGDRTHLSLTLAREQYASLGTSKEALLKRIEEIFPDYETRFDSYDEEDKKRRIAKVRTNFKLDGVVDYTHCSEEEIYELYRHSRVLNEAFLDADYEIRGETFFDAKSTIPLLFTFGLGPGGESWPHIGSSSSSMVDFWAGMGILEVRSERSIVPRIISKTQYDLIKDDLIKVPVKSVMSDICENYDYIYVYQGTLNF